MHITVQIWMMMTKNHIQSFCMHFYPFSSTRNSQIFSICVSHFVASSPEKSANIADVYCLLLHLTHPIQCNTIFFFVYIQMHSSEEYKYTMYDSFAYQLTVWLSTNVHNVTFMMINWSYVCRMNISNTKQ